MMAKMSSFTYLKYAELRFNIRSEPCGISLSQSPQLGERLIPQGGPTEDGGDEFEEAKEAMKRAIPARLRSWDNEKKLWHVFVTEQVRAALPAIFGNAEKLFLGVEQQPFLPGLEL
jgi:hypothetical protein